MGTDSTAEPSAQDSGMPGWLDTRTGKYHRMIEGLMTTGPNVFGEGKQGDFRPSHRVNHEEMAKPEAEGGSDWIELTTCKIHKATEAVEPIPPYLRGRIDAQGYFDVAPSEIKNWAKGGRE